MYCVYWQGYVEPECRMIPDLGAALKFAELKRNEGFRFVTLVSENPNSVGKPGVDVTGPDYDWVKRRSTALRSDTKA